MQLVVHIPDDILDKLPNKSVLIETGVLHAVALDAILGLLNKQNNP